MVNKTIIKNIKIKNKKVTAEIIVNEEVNKVWYEFPCEIKDINPANAFLVVTLPVAMRKSNELIIEGEVSEKLIEQLTKYQEIVKKWYPYLNKVEIKPNKIIPDKEYNENKKTICCFTGGVDAFYSTIKNLKEIDDLMYVWGFDIPLTEEKFYKKVEKNLKNASKQLNKKLILIKTNVGYEFTNKYASWGDLCYGSAIASTVILMGNTYNKSIIPSCNDYATLCPRGSHLLLNHLWNCDGLSFVYDGAECSRVEKVEYIAKNEIVSNYLRVCYRSNNEYNCCECEKCIRTMVSLDAVGKLEKVKSFNKKLNYKKLLEVNLGSESEYKMAISSKEYAEKNQKYELSNYLDKQIKNYEIKQHINFINENIDFFLEHQDSNIIKNKIFEHVIETDTKKSTKKIVGIIKNKIKRKIRK